ncbi:hypothetical protein ISF_07940 [Cordyceps fumosorosea ARSEF 2679]|uniref:Acyl-CoA N-acyltransferase n=1 Tax=Cordyceps fumosorosea (strain ARSEF 2679) TaxID=1081104 RepID=A0A167NDF9_CORFA|nr:hypothetical protein ISF_07940 [Cordyceps fumosorosea ARSEF 2679]OAA55429.1 hypothetical protein ISF_07940 [Cordyceps fumosorosea ARSEF 2679]
MAAIPTTTILPRTGKTAYTLRPAVHADVPGLAAAYYAAFADSRPGAPADNLLEVLFGDDHRAHPAAVQATLADILAPRLWSLYYCLSALVDASAEEEIVGFVCIKRPDCEVTFYERWLSPRAECSICGGRRRLRARSPASSRACAARRAEERRGTSPSWPCGPRCKAWGSNDAGAAETEAGAKQEDAEEGGPAVWLTARRGTEGLYRKLGFVKVMDGNTGPLSAWNGGAVMFRGLQGVEDRP